MGNQVSGLVIISFPPPGDPSKGKTLTAYVLSNHPEQLPRSPPPPKVPAPPSAKRKINIVFGFFVIILALWACTYSEGPLNLLRSSDGEKDEERREKSLVFPLYPKKGGPRFLLEENAGVIFSRKIRVAMNSSAVFRVGGNIFPDGHYYTSMRVGNPAREYFLDVDTGSALTWIQCDAPCQSCPKGPNPLYKPAKENFISTKHALCQELQHHQLFAQPTFDLYPQCDYEITYFDNSSSVGVLTKDDLDLHFSGSNKVNPIIVFGCAYNQKGQLSASPAKTDGVLGLARSEVSLPSQLSNKGLIVNMIGHCMKTDSSGGYLFFGDDFVPQHSMTWVPMVDYSRYYEVQVKGLSYGSHPIGNRGREIPEKIIFDTGSTYSYFSEKAYADLLLLVNTIKLERDESDETLPICWRTTSPIRTLRDVRKFFSPLTFHFKSNWLIFRRILQIQPEGYLVVNDRHNVCLGILNGTEVNNGSAIILGDISLRGLLVVYNNVDRQVGWVESDCRRLQKAIDFRYLF